MLSPDTTIGADANILSTAPLALPALVASASCCIRLVAPSVTTKDIPTIIPKMDLVLINFMKELKYINKDNTNKNNKD